MVLAQKCGGKGLNGVPGRCQPLQPPTEVMSSVFTFVVGSLHAWSLINYS